MFGWFAPKCPLNTLQKTWTETRMRWLATQFGIDRLLKAEVIEPTDQHFPGEYRGSKKDADVMFRRVCGWMQLDRTRFHLEIVPDEKLPGAVGQYHYRQRKPSIIQVATDTAHEQPKSLTVQAAKVALEEGTPSTRLAVFWELSQMPNLAPELAPGMLRCFIDNDATVSREAARLLPLFASALAHVVPVLVDTMITGNSERRANAAYILGELRLQH